MTTNMTPEEHLKFTAGEIRRIRKSRNWTIDELAFRANMERPNVSDIEAGKTDFRFTTLCRIAGALEISVKELVK